MFEFGFRFRTVDIHIQLALNRCRQFGLESRALSSHNELRQYAARSDFFVECRLPTQAMPCVCMANLPSLPRFLVRHSTTVLHVPAETAFPLH